jgi:hypothetical protein
MAASTSTFSASRDRVKQQLQLQSVDNSAEPATTIYPVLKATDLDNNPDYGTAVGNWARVNRFKAKSGEVLAVPDAAGSLACVVLGLGDAKTAEAVWAYAALPGKLPPATYAFGSGGTCPKEALLGWLLGELYLTRKGEWPGPVLEAAPQITVNG